MQQLNSEETLRLFDVAEIGDGQVIINEAMRLMSIEDEFELYTLQYVTLLRTIQYYYLRPEKAFG